MDAEALIAHLQATAERQRSQLARKLHDELAGLMVSALMDLSFATRQPAVNTEVQPQLDRAKATLKTAIDVSRRMVEDLRPSMLDNFGLFAALRWELKKASASSAAVCTQAYPDLDPGLDGEAAIALYRVAEEALALIFSRESVSTADLRVEITDGVLSMRFTDDGAALLENGREAGAQAALASMRHRIRALGGRVEMQRNPAGGSVLTASLPLERSAGQSG
jgi:signal transduction histidine kinase